MAVNDNPFDTQQQGQQPGLVGGAMQPATYQAEQRTVEPKQTVQGQVDSILNTDGPMMQRARSLALEEMNRRGLVNSSMAIQAGQTAVLDRALPIAQQDAATYANADVQNVDARNRSSEFNAGSKNQFGLQREAESFTGGENERQRQYQTSERQGQQQFQSTENQKQLAQQQHQFDVEEDNKFKMQDAQARADLDKLKLTNSLNVGNVPNNFAASVSTSTLDRVNAILADPNLTADAKRSAIDNAVNFANQTMAWAEKFYSVSLPKLTTPDTSSITGPQSKEQIPPSDVTTVYNGAANEWNQGNGP